ncbi:unnamed protein product [Bursaphelenchus xylophilus]|uniref:(pine wood nematode) hypothetical protein n=1 Tax=Bursaphelenchus xylophilus TaxID=6326 RepID=A0A1I7RZJ4_BURXY|nr:unnamed protein product [Bursaphelenchus xylophilus]CAG9111302.1 unnamed protein product [Bursaphelenchus xylophilus]
MYSSQSDVERLEPPSKVTIQPVTRQSLKLCFVPPIGVAAGVIKRYRVEWSTSSRFTPILGERECSAINAREIVIGPLEPQTGYYFRIASGTAIRFGPNRLVNDVKYVVQAWNDEKTYTSVVRRAENLLEQHNILITEHINRILCFVPSQSENSGKSKWSAVSKFAVELSKKIGGQKFNKGVHLIPLIMNGPRLLLTNDRVPPIYTVDDSDLIISIDEFNDLLRWLVMLPQQSRSINACHILQKKLSKNSLNRLKQKTLSTIANMLDDFELNHVDYFHYSYLEFPEHSNAKFFVCICDGYHGEIPWSMNFKPFPSILQDLKENSNLGSELCRKVVEIIRDKHKSERTLKPGLYVALLQFVSSRRQMYVLSSERNPSILPNFYLRENPFLTKREWDLLRLQKPEIGRIPTVDEIQFYERFNESVNALFRGIGLEFDPASYRLWDEYVFEHNNVTMLIIVPAPENLCLFAPDLNGQDFKRQLGKRFMMPIISFHIEYIRSTFPSLVKGFTKIKTYNDLLEQILPLCGSADKKTDLNKAKVLAEHQSLNSEFSNIWQLICWSNQAIKQSRDKSNNFGVHLDQIFRHFDSAKALTLSNVRFGQDGKTIKVKVDDKNLSNLGLEPYAILEINENTTVEEVVGLVIKNVFRDNYIMSPSSYDLLVLDGIRERRFRPEFILGELREPWTNGKFLIRPREFTTCSSSNSTDSMKSNKRWKVLPC